MRSFLIYLLFTIGLVGCSTFSNEELSPKNEPPVQSSPNKTPAPMSASEALGKLLAGTVASEIDVNRMRPSVSTAESREAFMVFMNHLHRTASSSSAKQSARDLEFSTSEEFTELLGLELGVRREKCELGGTYEYGGACFNDRGKFTCLLEKSLNIKDYCFTKLIFNR